MEFGFLYSVEERQAMSCHKSHESLETTEDFIEHKKLSFAALPYAVQHMLVDKLKQTSFAEFIQSSEVTERWCTKTGKRCLLPVETIYIQKKKWEVIIDDDTRWDEKRLYWQTIYRCKYRISSSKLEIGCSLTNQLAAKLINKFSKAKTTATKIILDNEIKCSLENLSKLLEVMNANELIAYNPQMNCLLEIPIIRKMESIEIYDQLISSEVLFSIQSKDIVLEVSNISAATVAKLLDEWRRGVRTIEHLELYLPTNIINNLIALLPSIGANVVWTPEDHENSIVHMLDKNTLPFAHCRLYSIQQLNTDVHYYLDVSESDIRFCELEKSERELILHELNDFQYMQVIGQCRVCPRGSDCYHRLQSINQ